MIRKTCRRYDVPGHAHELTFSCYRRLPLLSRDRTRRWFVEALDTARSRLGFDLWGYVIMPEHVHVLIWPRQPECRIARVLRHVKRPVARRAIAFLERRAPDWLDRYLTVPGPGGASVRQFRQAGGGYDRNLYDARTVSFALSYIQANPVRRGLVERPKEWPWSSAAWYAGHHPATLEMDPTLPRVYEL